MYVVTVEFDIDPAFIAKFMAAVLANARDSHASEPGCLQFDVCTSEDDPSGVFLYEVYRDRLAFDAHVASDHFRRFDAAANPWVRDKQVRTYCRLASSATGSTTGSHGDAALWDCDPIADPRNC